MVADEGQVFGVVFWLVQGLITIICIGMATWVKHLQEQIEKLREAKHNQNTEMSALKILVAGEYLKRDEFVVLMREMTHEVRLGFGDIHKKIDSGFSELYDELKDKLDKPKN